MTGRRLKGAGGLKLLPAEGSRRWGSEACRDPSVPSLHAPYHLCFPLMGQFSAGLELAWCLPKTLTTIVPSGGGQARPQTLMFHQGQSCQDLTITIFVPGGSSLPPIQVRPPECINGPSPVSGGHPALNCLPRLTPFCLYTWCSGKEKPKWSNTGSFLHTVMCLWPWHTALELSDTFFLASGLPLVCPLPYLPPTACV